jgi:hypothetical protein
MRDRARIAIVAILLLAVVLVVARCVQLQNNGDGWRVLRSAQIEAPADYYTGQPFPRFFDFTAFGEMTPRYLVPAGPSAAIVEVISFVQRGLGFRRFDFMAVTALYAVLYVAGVLLIALRARRAFWIPAAFILLNPFVLAYFNSPYEESLFIALTPLMAYLLVTGMRPLGGARATALTLSVVKVQFAPAVLLGISRGSTRSNIVYAMLALIVVVATFMKASVFNAPNAYHRYFNGLAYSTSGVSSWPAHDFIARRAAADTLVDDRGIVFPADSLAIREHWGSSYWANDDRRDSSDRNMMAQRAAGWYRETLRVNPALLGDVIVQPVLTAITADYRLEYIFRSDIDARWLVAFAATMKHFGWLILAASVASIVVAARRRNTRVLLVAIATLLYPILAVFGDGYYEFEKHLLPVLYLGLVISLSLVAIPHVPRVDDGGPERAT